ncbi:NUDIX domain-containing protein [Nocardioides sp. KIGAM211]|uniref:8-oxo-dGTP diphosphatase n=1 Tax=Nocardioides luti TaxID=2761101 RepID=A0A7X0RI24_9ACTN|nr:NUDIX domain-containing protein [Nocardioides luti]
MGDRIPIAVAALVRDGRVLLVHRHPARAAYPDCWDLVGGHVEAGESAREAVVRECREELGVDVHDPVPLAVRMDDPALALQAFVVRRWDGEPVNAAPDEHDDLGWFGPDDLDDLVLAHAGLRPGLLRALRAPVKN